MTKNASAIAERRIVGPASLTLTIPKRAWWTSQAPSNHTCALNHLIKITSEITCFFNSTLLDKLQRYWTEPRKNVKFGHALF